MRGIRRFPATTLLLLLLPLASPGCRSEEEKAADALEGKVMATLDNTPEHLKVEVLRTCDKWRRLDRGEECVEADARRDQFECWLERGYPKLEHGYQYKLRPRARDQTTLLKQDHCMELRRWKLIKGRRATYEHLFGAPQAAARP
ncbi:MAG: hypothetical protein ACR2P8_03110 [Myxococcota bacterium]